MSHEATNWAMKVRGIEPIEKLVLLFLADCHDHYLGCRASLEWLSVQCEISISQLQDILDKLKHDDLIHHGGKNGQENIFLLGFEFRGEMQ